MEDQIQVVNVEKITPEIPIVEVLKHTEEVTIVEIPAKLYNKIRSFVESSSKPEYPWNKGYKLNRGAIFIKEGKWKLYVFEHTVDDIAQFREGDLAVIATLDHEVELVIDKDYNIMLIVDGKEFHYRDRYRYALTAKVHLAYPIFLYMIFNKFFEYCRIRKIVSIH
jgi:hypothetical protein